MDAIQLLEYRCGCGKLLFKGVLFLGAVEVKCRRCGQKLLVKELEPGTCTYIECDTHLYVTSVSKYTCSMFGYDAHDLIGKELQTFFPLLRDGGSSKNTHALKDERPYKIQNNTFMLKDGNTVPLKSYFIPKKENGTFSGYKVLNWLTEPQQEPI